MVSTHASLSIGLAGTLGPDTIARLARTVEDAGFDGLWVNDTPGGDAIAALGAAARTTRRITLGTGVVPLDRRSAAEVVEALDRAAVPDDRLIVGIGSGQAASGQLALVRDGIDRLRRSRDARIVVGALGPRMRRLGARDADGVLLNWLTPGAVAAQREEAHRESPSARVSLYVRTAFGAAARERMAREADRYAGFPNYAANFARLGFAARDTVLPPPEAGDDPAGMARALGAYLESADEIVLRAITADDGVAAYEGFIADAAAAASAARPREAGE